MKTLAFLFCFSFFSFCKTSLAQIDENILDINNFHVPVNAQAMLGFVEGSYGYSDVPAGSGIPSLFISTLWMAGKKSYSGAVHGFCPMYTSEYNGVTLGPVYAEPLTVFDSIDFYSTYNRVWKISRTEIENHKLNFDKAGYEMPEVIRNWPGNGNTALGMSSILAPFTDYNANGIYEPALGDHPNIKGDAAIYVLCNNHNTQDPHYVAEKMNIEIHLLLYAYEAAQGSVLDNTVFVNYTVYNRSEDADYDSVYIGQFVEFDLGCLIDDHVGCDSMRNLFYIYNGDDYDDICPYGYKDTLPAIGCLAMSDPLHAFMYLNHDNTYISLPDNAKDIYSFMSGRFKDGTQMTYGGNGYGGTQPVNYMFPSDVTDPTGWSEITEGNTPADRNGFGSMGPFTFKHGESMCAEFAFVYANANIPDDNLASISLLQNKADLLIGMYPYLEEEECVSYKTGSLSIPAPESEKINIYPVPADDNVFIETNVSAGENILIELYSVSGKLIQTYILINTGNKEVHHLPVGDIPIGVYILHITSGAESLTKQIIIK